MATPTTLTDIVTLLAVLLGSITAGIMFMRPLRNGPHRRVGRRRNEAATLPLRQASQPGRALPPMLGGDIFER